MIITEKHNKPFGTVYVDTIGPFPISIHGNEYAVTLICDLTKYLVTSTAHHHQTLGTIERSHRTFNEYVRSYISVEKDDWDEWFRYFTYCFNTTLSIIIAFLNWFLVK